LPLANTAQPWDRFAASLSHFFAAVNGFTSRKKRGR
jgi:hypothetical protein